MSTYRFVQLDPMATASYNKLYVEAFVGAMNDRDYVKHRLTHGREGVVDEQGWSWGIPPRYNDGRVTTRRCSWVYAKKTDRMPEDACAMVFFTTSPKPIGYLVKEG